MSEHHDVSVACVFDIVARALLHVPFATPAAPRAAADAMAPRRIFLRDRLVRMGLTISGAQSIRAPGENGRSCRCSIRR
jgi:hypothetical protein